MKSPSRPFFEVRPGQPSTFPRETDYTHPPVALDANSEAHYSRNTVALQVDDRENHFTVIMSPDAACDEKKHIGMSLFADRDTLDSSISVRDANKNAQIGKGECTF